MIGGPCKQFYTFVVDIPPIMLARFIEWLTHDAAGFFTFILFLVGIVQAGLFVWQLRLIRKSLRPAEEAARAATANARAMIENERPWIGVDTVWSKKVEIAQISQGPNGEVRMRLHDKHAALVSIGKHLGMFTDQVQVRARYATSRCRPRSGKSSTSRKADKRCVLAPAKRRALGQVRFGFGNSGASRPIPQPTRAQPLS
jgi:hypothetical protein